MYLRLIAMFSLGATVGYEAHRPAEPAAMAGPVLRTAEVAQPPARAFARAHAVPQLPDLDPPAELEIAPADAAGEPVADPPQPQGVLQGTVTNRAGEPIYWVKVTAQSVLGDELVTHTNSEGFYRFDSLPSAVYKLHFACDWMTSADGDAGVNQLDPTVQDVTLDAVE